MQIEKQVCTLEQAKRLKELGVEQCGNFTWIYDTSNFDFALSHRTVEEVELLRKSNLKSKEWQLKEEKEFYSAFTCAELGELLPDEANTFRIKGKWYSDAVETDMPGGGKHEHEAWERADLLILLLEQSDISPSEINQRLHLNK